MAAIRKNVENLMPGDRIYSLTGDLRKVSSAPKRLSNGNILVTLESGEKFCTPPKLPVKTYRTLFDILDELFLVLKPKLQSLR